MFLKTAPLRCCGNFRSALDKNSFAELTFTNFMQFSLEGRAHASLDLLTPLLPTSPRTHHHRLSM